MMRTILVVGMILLLSSACLPQRGSISEKVQKSLITLIMRGLHRL